MGAEEITTFVLRREIAQIVGAAFVASLGIAALTLYWLRRRATDATAPAFSAFALLYAIRLAASATVVRVAVGMSTTTTDYLDAGLTYAILIPATWFAEALQGRGWRGGLEWLRRAAIVIAPVAIVGMFVIGKPRWAMLVNNVLVLALVALTIATARRHPLERTPTMRFVRVGLLSAIVFVIAENLRAIGVVRWPQGIEYIGVLIFLSSLAIAVAERFLSVETRLVAVERELATARQIQQAILPERVPSLQQFAMSVQYVPMTEVAGDFYDFLHFDGRSGTVLVTDVSGHGVPAALIASMIKVAAASHIEVVTDPGQLLTALSQTLDGQLGGQFLTAACLHLDGVRKEISYAGAGHPPVLHWRAAERRLEPLASGGILIGLAPATYVSHRTQVNPGDRLLVYTDGVTEATNEADEFFGDERFPAVISAYASRSGSDLAAAILAEMSSWSAQRVGFTDDVTLVVIEVR